VVTNTDWRVGEGKIAYSAITLTRRLFMEKRLIPVNALIGLVTRGDFAPPVLADAGYYAAGLEATALTPDGKVVIDVVIANSANSHLLACESKSGNNIEAAQAKRYAALDGPTVVQAALVTLRERVEPLTEVVYACLGEHQERITLGLDSLGLSFPIIAVHASSITLENPQHASDDLRSAFMEPVQFSTSTLRFIPFDHDSPADVIEPYVRARLIASLAQQLPQITIGALTELTMPHYALYSRGVQVKIRRKVSEVTRKIAQSESETFEYHPPPPNGDGWVRFTRTPEDNDRRGRTQAYQAFARRSRARRPRAGRDPGEGQLDLLSELDGIDNVDEGTSDKQEEGRT
jgi:hypothetical protein